jgi:hypothetical protein
MEVLLGFDIKKYAPRVFVIEDNSGGSASCVKDYLDKVGYKERFRTETNVFYTRIGDPTSFTW